MLVTKHIGVLLYLTLCSIDLFVQTIEKIAQDLIGRSVFVAGETISCQVTVANVVRPSQHGKANGSVATSVG